MEGIKANKIRNIVKLRQIVKKWRKFTNSRKVVAANMGRALCVKHLCSSGFPGCRDSDHKERSYVPPDVPAGHLAVYVGSCLRRRFVIKATLLNEPLFRALLEKAADEFGFHCQGGITIPCEIGEFENILFQLSRQYRYPVKNIRNEEPMGLYEDNSRCNIENDSTPLLYVTA
eukprot:Gb_18130 [translate_table: standard]